MGKYLILILGLIVGLDLFSQNDIEYNNKRLISSLKKNGISEFSELKEISIDSNKSIDLKGKFFSVPDNLEVKEVKYVFVGRVNSCRAGGCSVSNNTSVNQQSEYFDYFILFDSFKTVKLVEVYNYQATHGYEITSKGWLKQFVGFSKKDTLVVNKDIDSISGATISVYAITGDVQLKTKMLESIN